MTQEYPKVRDRCPCCGSAEREVEQLVKEQIENGKLSKREGIGQLFQQTSVVKVDRRMLLPGGVRMPGVQADFDICAECGTCYAVRVRKGPIELPTVELPPPAGGSSQVPKAG